MQFTLETVFADAPALCDEVAHDVEISPKLHALAWQSLVGSSLYGACMGLHHSWKQAAVSAVKTPLLFLLTLVVCLPALHFVGLLFGSRVRFSHSLTVLLAGMATTSILLAAFAPIAVFFLVTGSSYPFLLLLHVAIFAFAGAAGLRSVLVSFRHLRVQSEPSHATHPSRLVLGAWMLLYGFVGTQMAFVLGPFVGRETTFLWFHHPAGNFYSYVLATLVDALR